MEKLIDSKIEQITNLIQNHNYEKGKDKYTKMNLSDIQKSLKDILSEDDQLIMDEDLNKALYQR